MGSPRFNKVVRILLIVGGGLSIMSAVANLITTIGLVDFSEEEMLGVSRNFLITEYSLMLVVGAVLLILGLRRKK